MMDNWNIAFWDYEYLAPNWFYALALIPFIIYLLYKSEKKAIPDAEISILENQQENLQLGWVKLLRQLLNGLIIAIYVLLVTALAKPYNWESKVITQEEFENGIDIVIALDVSLSMYAKDFHPNRLEASKQVAKEFIDSRRTDRIGLVVYAGEAFTSCPTTLDHYVLKAQLDKVDGENIDPGTAIGTGLGTAVARLRSDSLTSKVVILLTDGSNNTGSITPEIASELAVAKNVKVYTIGVGTNGNALSPVVTPFGVRFENIPVEIDEETLIKIAEKTGGKYFRATDNEALKSIYNEIERLEKREIKSDKYKVAKPANPIPFIKVALLLLIVVWGTKKLVFKDGK
jgi:Ca-activated chloride channel family protein